LFSYRVVDNISLDKSGVLQIEGISIPISVRIPISVIQGVSGGIPEEKARQITCGQGV
jgi:hypothetical protein